MYIPERSAKVCVHVDKVYTYYMYIITDYVLKIFYSIIHCDV